MDTTSEKKDGVPAAASLAADEILDSCEPMNQYANWCRCCGNLKNEHPVTSGWTQLCAIFLAFDEIAHKNFLLTLATPKHQK